MTKFHFFSKPFTSDSPDKKSSITLIKIHGVLKNLFPAKFVFDMAYMKKNPSKTFCVGV